MNAKVIKDRFEYYRVFHDGSYPPSPKARGVYVGILNKVCKGDANRKLVIKYLTGKTSTKLFDTGDWIAMRKLCDISPVELEKYCGIILGEVVKQEGQIEMELT